MKDKDLIKNLKALRKTEPDKDWVLSVKESVLGKEVPSNSLFNRIEETIGFIFHHKPAFATLTVFICLISVVTIAERSLPGDSLYSVKRTVEGIQIVLKGEENPKLSFEVVTKRLEELNKVVEKNSAKNLAPAINEFQASVSEVAKNIKVDEIKDIKVVSKEISKIDIEKERIKSLGIEIGENKDLEDLKVRLNCRKSEDLIVIWGTGTLNKNQEEALEKARELYNEKECASSLEILLSIENIEETENDSQIVEETEEEMEIGIVSEKENEEEIVE